MHNVLYTQILFIYKFSYGNLITVTASYENHVGKLI